MRQNISLNGGYSPNQRTITMLYYRQNFHKEEMTMYQMRNVGGHIQVYDNRGRFLFSADTEREAREELEEYAESAA